LIKNSCGFISVIVVKDIDRENEDAGNTAVLFLNTITNNFHE